MPQHVNIGVRPIAELIGVNMVAWAANPGRTGIYIEDETVWFTIVTAIPARLMVLDYDNSDLQPYLARRDLHLLPASSSNSEPSVKTVNGARAYL